jgi:hypothetical protein
MSVIFHQVVFTQVVDWSCVNVKAVLLGVKLSIVQLITGILHVAFGLSDEPKALKIVTQIGSWFVVRMVLFDEFAEVVSTLVSIWYERHISLLLVVTTNGRTSLNCIYNQPVRLD